MNPRISGNAGLNTRYGPAYVPRLINTPSKLAIVMVNLFEVADTPDYETIWPDSLRKCFAYKLWQQATRLCRQV